MNIYPLIVVLLVSSGTLYTQNTAPTSHNQHATTIHTAPQNHSHATGAHQGHGTMHGMYGSYPMTREASGTSWVPDSSPPEGHYAEHEKWQFMIGGFSYLVADKQTGPRGGRKIMNENMFMFMGQRDIGTNTIAFRSMLSLEPITIGTCGYPLLLQTGETCDGITLLIDRQHPHDLFMELALVHTCRFNETTSAFLYVGLPGEPALGPPIFLMRFSGEYIPESPIGHHWMDSTHITFGVLTCGVVHHNFKFECSVFNGREPDQHRFDIEKPRFNSYSFRCSLNPTENIALQASYGHIKHPEILHPTSNLQRITLSALYNKNFADNILQATAIVGINRENSGTTLPAFLLEATLELHKKHMLFTRFEIVTKSDLFIEPHPLAGRSFNVQKLTLGYIYEFGYTRYSKCGAGALLDIPMMPRVVSRYYDNAYGYMFFLQIRLI